MKFKIVHVTAKYPPSLGGLQKVVQLLAEEQQKAGLDVSVITSTRGTEGIEIADTVPVKRLFSFEFAHTPLILGLLPSLLRLSRKSVMHLHVAQAYVPEMVLLAHLIKKIPYIAHMHLDIAPSGPAGFLLKIYKPLILKRVLRRAQFVVVFSNEQRSSMIEKYGLLPERVQVVPNGIEAEFFDSTPRIMHLKPRLLFVGRLSAQKNVAQLLDALHGVSNSFETRIVGDGELRQDLQNLTTKLKLENVTFCGRLGGTDLIEEYLGADVFVLPSEREGMPLVLLEALATSLPVVGTNVLGIRDLVTNGKNGLLVPFGDAKALQTALQQIAKDTASYKKMSENSYKIAQQYTWQRVADDFVKLYGVAYV